MEFILPLLGRFHPLFVHLPIGILLFGVILVFLPSNPKQNYLPAVRVAFLVGTFFGLLSAISGFLQYQHEGYTWERVKIHLLLGWSTVIFSGWLYLQFRKCLYPSKSLKTQSILIVLLISLTGHFGGIITHGSDYLIEVLPSPIQQFFGVKINQIEAFSIQEDSWQEALFYDDVIQPILSYNCVSCHNPRNLKGELDLSSIQGLKNGGKNGAILKANHIQESALYTRLILPHEDEEHMPPAEKRQPRVEEIELIKKWIESGASLDQNLAQAEIKKALIQPLFKKEEIYFYPIVSLKSIDPDRLSLLRSNGFFVEALAKDNPLLRLGCLNFPKFSNSDWQLLSPYKAHLAYVDLSETAATELIIDSLATLPNLTILKLNHLQVTGESLQKLQSCKNLKLLYLNYTEVTATNLAGLEGHPSLEKVFVFNTPAAIQTDLKFSFEVESGAYLLPKLDSDTIVY